MFAVACEDPTLLIGARPISEPEEREGGAGDEITARPDPTGAADRDARVGSGADELDAGAESPADADDLADASIRAPAVRPDAGLPMPDDEPDPGADRDPDRGPDGDPWRPPPEPRPRFAYRCRADYECSRLRGVCDRGWCVQCRSRSDCPLGSVCSPDRVCVRRPPGG